MPPIILALIIALGIGLYIVIYAIVMNKLLEIIEDATDRNEREQWRKQKNMK